MTCHEAEPLLHARLDDELDVAGAASVDRHLSECRACAAQYATLRSLREEIASAGLAYAVPSTLERKLAARFLQEEKSPESFWRRPWTNVSSLAGAAAALVVLFLAVSLTWMVMRSRGAILEADAIATEVLDNHLRELQPGHAVDVPSSDQHTVKPWFQGKTGFSPPAPDLTNDGFALIGGRLEVIHQQPAAAIVYRRRQHLISLYVSPSQGADAPAGLRELDGYHLLHWKQNGLDYWAVSDVDATDLRRFANLIGGQ